MTTRIKKTLIILCCLVIFAPLSTLADGMMVPPKDYWIQETDQKAVIFYDQGVETMVVSVAFEGNAEDFGWVIPVPSRPEVNKGSDELFTSLEELTGTTYYNDYMVPQGVSTLERSADEVTIIETKKVGYYDVTILSSTDEDALTDWLQQNDYNFPSSASYILNSYIQNDWYFVAMQINPKSLGWSDVSQQLREGHATPVVISFPTDNIVYPLKISSVTSRESESITDTTNAYTDSTVTYTTGKIGKGIELDNNDAVSFEADDYFNASEGTIEMWIKPDASWGTTPPGYWELFTVATSDGSDILEFRAGQDSAHDNLQFITYNPSATVWKTIDQVELIWDHTQWYYVAVTWSADNSPQIYINGIAQTMEASYSGNSWTMRSAEGGTVYLNQRKSYWGTNSGRAVYDEVKISNARKTAAEISTAYNAVLSNQAFEVEGNTLLLAHFNNNLLEEKTGEYLDHSNITGAAVIEKTVSPIYYDSYINILLYVIADNKKFLPGFSTHFANTIDKNSIEKLALNDQGNPLLQPTDKKYFLTKLSDSMTYTEMTEDLFLRKADDYQTIGQPIKSAGANLKNTFYVLIIISVVLSVIFAITILVISYQAKPPPRKKK